MRKIKENRERCRFNLIEKRWRCIMIHLQRSMIEGLEGPGVTVHSVLTALQKAVKLEHATIPVYLYALYSLDPAKNAEIAAIIASVVVEEMLHMTLASNVLNALGGSPVIDRPGFIPTYPGPLPGGVESELRVNLAPFSMKQLETFLQIEEPEHPLQFEALAGAAPITIGQFYAKISKAIGQLGDGAFVEPPRNQVGPDLMDESVVVTDVPTAQRAISTIVEQGEGTSTSPEEVVGSHYAHYYRFMQIQKGHLLVKVPDAPPPQPKYAYTGTAVPFDPTGVYAVPTNPALPPGYPAGSAQAFANNNFNYTYTSLLRALHDLVNGKATQNQINRTIGLMMSLKGQAKAMMAGIPNPAVHAGPSFEYCPVDPSI
jgi:rubrerythrin